MAVDQADPFGVVLSRYRVAAGLTQEELAEQAGLSSDAISTLERGVRTRPRPDTVRRLVEALGLSSDDQASFEQAARAAAAVPPEPPQEETLPVGEFLGAVPAGALIGREEDGERCRAALDAMGEGIGHVLLLTGEAGIGKTRLLQDLMVEARSRGYLVLTGRCTASDQGRSYSPIAQLLGRLAGVLPTTIRAGVQRQVKPIQYVMDTAPSGDAMRPERGVASQEEFFSAVSDLLLLVARSVPVVLLLDDLHWVDGDSLQLLDHLARTLRTSPVFIGAAIRDTRLTEEHAELAHTVQRLSRERLAERVVVRRLSLEETTHLVGTLMGEQPVSEEFASFVYRRTKGIPRFIDQLVRSLGGRLELQGEIGAGSMGRVFRAYDRERAEEVAAKLVLARQEIDLDALLRFQQEGAVLARLEHPQIVRIYDTFAEEHASCIIMELLPGRSLGQILHDGPLPLERAKHLVCQVADALSYAHTQSIVHRDIKPDNVMVLEGDQVKVTDFGIARILQPDTSLQTIATTGMRMGTPLYMAPEQIEGNKIDSRTDLYALGAMLYHMVTGRPPFEGNDALSVAVKHLQEEPLPPSQVELAVPKEWDAVILKALAKEPRNRYQSAGEMHRAIEALPLRPARPQTRRRTRRAIRAVVAGTATSVVTITVALALFWPHFFAAGQSQSPLERTIDDSLTSLANQHQLSGTVLVAQKGKIILAKGYGMANRSRKIPNSPNTVYPIGGVSGALSTIAGLMLENNGTLHSKDHVCSYFALCPTSWKPITVDMVLNGTSGLPVFSWGDPGRTIGARGLSTCEQEPLTAPPGRGPVSYQNCTGPVLDTIIQKATGKPYATVMRQLILGPTGMRHSGYLVDQHLPTGLAVDYSGAGRGQSGGGQGQGGGYNGLFQLFTTAGDIYRFDNALFEGRILSQTWLSRLFALRSPVTPPDLNIQGDSWGDRWKIGTAFGHQVIYTNGHAYSFSTADMRFPGDGVTIIVISNDDQNDVLGVATQVATSVFGTSITAPAPALAPAASSSTAIVATIRPPHVFGLSAVSNGTFWLVGDQTGVVTRMDPATNKIVATIKVNDPSKHPGLIDAGLVFVVSGSGEVWALDRANKEAVRINPRTNRVMDRVPLGIEPGGGTIRGQTLWVTTGEDEPAADTIVKIDLRSEKVVARITNAKTTLGELYLPPTAGPDALWYVDWSRGIVKRLDAVTNMVIATIKTPDPQPADAVADGQTVWVTSHFLNLVTRIDARTNTVIASIPLTGYPSGTESIDCCAGALAEGGGAVWTIAGSGSRTLVRIDPHTNRVTASLTFSQAIGTVAFMNGSVWVEGPDKFYRIDPAAMKGT